MNKLNILAAVFITGSKAINIGEPQKSSNMLAQSSSTCKTSFVGGPYGGFGVGCGYGNRCGYGNGCGNIVGGCGSCGGCRGYPCRPNLNNYCQSCDCYNNFC